MKSKIPLPVWLLIATLSLIIITEACDINDSSPDVQPMVETSVKPAQSGTIHTTGNELYASTRPGYYFQYWKLSKPDGSLRIAYDDSIQIASDSIKSAKAVFAPTDIDVVHLPSTSNGRYAYFVTEMYVPIDTTGREKSVYAFVRADLKNHTKKKIYITDKRVRHFDISSDNRYIAFSSYHTDDSSSFDVDTYLYDRQTNTLTATHTGGSKVLWAHHGDSLLVGSKKGLYIYRAKYDQRDQLSLPSGAYHRTEGFEAAAWSPDDKHIVLYRDAKSFQVYDTKTLERSDLSSNASKSFFFWLDNKSFVTNKSNVSYSLTYSLDDLSNPHKISLKDIGIYKSLGTSLSPTKTTVAYISDGPYQKGIDLYDFTSGETQNILNYSKYDPIVLNWVQTSTIIFNGRKDNMIKMISPSGDVSLL